MNVLVLRHSAAFEHSYLPDAEVAFKTIGRAHGWRVKTTHQLERITPESLSELDVLVFATSGDLPFTAEQRSAILDFVRAGKGFFGVHNATDSCYDWPEYGEMIGGYFDGHPWNQTVRVIVEDPDHPATRALPPAFEVRDEIYTFRSWDRGKTHVLLRLDNESVDVSKGRRPDRDYALAWCHGLGSGRVIYTALGHREALWKEPWFLEHIAGCLRWAAKLA